MHLRHFVTLLLITLLLTGVVAPGFRIAPAAAEEAERSEWWLSAEATTDKSSEPAAPQIAMVVRRLKPKTGAMAVAWSPDGKLLATMGGLRGRITLWDPQTGKMVWDVVGDRIGSEALAFSNDGRLLLTTVAKAGPEDQDAALTLWDVATGAVAGRVAGYYPNKGPVANSARTISLDRAHGLLALIASHGPGEPVGIYDMKDWALQGTVAVAKDTPEAVAFGPDGTLAVGTIGGQIALFDARTRTLKRVIDTGPTGVESLAYSPDGRYVVSGAFYGPDPIRVWSTTDGGPVRSYTAQLSGVHGLSWSADGRYIASASFNGPIWLWSYASSASGQAMEAFDSGAWSVAFSPDGRLLAAGSSQDDVIIAEIKQ
jgi:WD40 repeat protein